MKRILSMATLLLLAGICSCSDGDDAVVANKKGSNDPIAVEFSEGIITRASGTEWANDDRIGIYMLDAGTTTSYTFDGVTYANIQYYNDLSSGRYATFEVVDVTELIYYPLDDELCDFVGIYPYNSELTSTNFLYALNVKDQSNKPAIDLMTAKLENIETTLDPIAFNFTHSLSQLNFTVKSGEGEPSLDGLEIYASGMKHVATYDVMSHSIDFGSTMATTLTVLDESAIVIPQSATGVVFHVVTTNSPEGFDTDPVDVTFEPGMATTITLTLNREEVFISGSSTITGWQESDQDLDLDALQVSASFSAEIQSDDATNVTYTSDDPNIGLFMFDSTTTTIVDDIANIEYEATNAGGFNAVDSSQTIYYPEDSAAVDFVTYAPYGNKVGAEDFIYEVDSAEGDDFMMAEKLNDVVVTQDNLPLTFRHMLSKINVDVTSGVGAPDLTGLCITINGLIATGSLDIRDDAPTVTLSQDGASAMVVEDSIDAIIIPQSASLTFTITTDSSSSGFTTEAREFNFEPGEQTSLSLSVNKTGVEFDGASVIIPWESVKYNGGEVVELF